MYHVLAQAQEENVCQSRSPPCSHLCVPLNNLTEDGSLSTTCLCPRDFIKVDEATCTRNSSEEFPNTNEITNKKEEESLNYTLIFSVTGSSVLFIICIAALVREVEVEINPFVSLYLFRPRGTWSGEDLNLMKKTKGKSLSLPQRQRYEGLK